MKDLTLEKSQSLADAWKVGELLKHLKPSGFLLAVIANILWGSSFLASKYTLEAWGPSTAAALRFLVALPVMAIVLPLLGYEIRLPKWRELKGLFAIALAGFGVLYPLQLMGLSQITSGLSASIMLTSPLFVVAMSHLMLGEFISLRKIMALLFGVGGGLLLLNVSGASLFLKDQTNVFFGALLTFGASVALAMSVILTRRFSSEHRMDSANITFWTILFGLTFLLPMAGVETYREGYKAPEISSVLALLYLSVFCSAFCFFIWNVAISKSSAKDLATTMHIKTPTAVLLGVVVASEALSLQMIVGTLVVGYGVYLSQSEKSHSQKKV